MTFLDATNGGVPLGIWSVNLNTYSKNIVKEVYVFKNMWAGLL